MTDQARADGAAGGFAEVLRTAIADRGLSLERVRQHLALRGVSVSLATLSYWQTGRSRPERRASMVAVGVLEQVLRLDAGTLSGLLEPPRRTRKAVQRPAIGALWPQSAEVEDVVGAVDTAWDARLSRISQHDVVVVGAEQGERSFTTRQVLRAEEDGPDRWVVVVHLDEHDRALPLVRPVRNCVLGRVVTRPSAGLLVAELLFPRPLRRGQTVITEHELVNRAPYPRATNYERKFRLPVRQYVLEVNFDPAALPARCERHTVDARGEHRDKAVALDDTGSVHGVALDFGPGCFGFRWTW